MAAKTLAAILLLFYHQSMALPVTHHLRSTVDLINRDGPFIGIVMSYRTEEDALALSGEFVARNHVPYIDHCGRRFHIGSIRDVDVIYVLTGQRRLNAGITVQILLDVFDVRGIVHYGTAGSANNSMSFGDVSVPKFVAFTGSWTWTRFGSKNRETPALDFDAFNIQTQSKNLLSGVEFKPEEFYSDGKPMEEVFWMQVNSEWYNVAKQLKIKLERCANKTYCLPNTPKIVAGLKACTADVFLDNAAYREFLFRKFGVSTVDEESAAVVMTALSPGVPVIVFRGVSDLAGGEEHTSSSLMELASLNALKAAIEFVGVIGKKKQKPSSFTSKRSDI